MSSGDVLALLGIIFGSQALWNFLQSLFQKKDPWQELLIGLGHDRITSLCEQEIKTGYTTPYRFHNIVEIYEPYKKAGGDGDAEMMFNYNKYKDFISSCIIPTFLAGAHSVPGLFIFFLSYSPRDEKLLYNEGDRIGDMLWRS